LAGVTVGEFDVLVEALPFVHGADQGVKSSEGNVFTTSPSSGHGKAPETSFEPSDEP
jgi:hypothetical protein